MLHEAYLIHHSQASLLDAKWYPKRDKFTQWPEINSQRWLPLKPI